MKKCVMGLLFILAPIAVQASNYQHAVYSEADDNEVRGEIGEKWVLIAENDVTSPINSASPTPSLMEPTNPGEAIGFMGPLVEAFKSKNWEVFTALLIMIVVYGLRLILPSLQTKPHVLALVSGAIGVVSSVAMNLYSKVGILNAIIGGLFLGAAASGFWSQLFKFVFPKKETV